MSDGIRIPFSADESGDRSNLWIALGLSPASPTNIDADLECGGETEYQVSSYKSMQLEELIEENLLRKKVQLAEREELSKFEVRNADSSKVIAPDRDVESCHDYVIAIETKEEDRKAPESYLPIVNTVSNLQELLPSAAAPGVTDAPRSSTEKLRQGSSKYGAIEEHLPPLVEQHTNIQLIHPIAQEPTKALLIHNRHVTWMGYAVLLVSLIAVSSQGAAVLWLPNVSGMIAASWLMQSQTLFLVPFCVVQLMLMTEKQREVLLQFSTWKKLFWASVYQVLWASGFFVAIDFTSLFHAWTLNNIHTVIMMAMRILQITNSPFSRSASSREKEGTVFAAAGALMMQIPSIVRRDTRALFGDMLAVASSIFAILYLRACKQLSSMLPVFVVLTPVTISNAVLFSAGAIVFERVDYSVSDEGLFGWIAPNRIVLGMYLGGVVGFLGTVCCIFALKMVSPVVVGSVQTMMPVIGTLVAVLAGVSKCPDFWTSLGGALVLIGIVVIAEASRDSEHKIMVVPEGS